MKSIIYLGLIVAFIGVSTSCSDKPVRPAPVATQSQIDGANARAASDATATPATTPEPAQNAAGVWHYTCSNGCSGGAGSAVACATCGSTLVHNQAYHSNTGTTTPPPTTTPSIGATSSANNVLTAPAAPGAALPPPITPPVNEPPQNAAGVWHYTCSNGCAGGAGSAVACATCGSTLAHNQAYHN